MGLMNKLNKMKSFLLDEVDEDEKPKKSIIKMPKKESKHEVKKEIIDDDSKTKEMEEFDFEDISEKVIDDDVETEVKSRVVKNEKEFEFPEFNDDDFMVSSKKPEPIIPIKIEEPKPTLYQGRKKEDSKKFKPTPMISPVYGLLDDEGNKVDKEETSEILANTKDDTTLDEVRRKAYGEVEDTMNNLSKKTIEEAERDMEKEEREVELSRTKVKTKIKEVEAQKIEKKEEEPPYDEDDDMILPNVNFTEIDVDKEREKSHTKSEKKALEEKVSEEDDDEDTMEQDLFNLIDSMHTEKENE